jgi:hypothetical protein
VFESVNIKKLYTKAFWRKASALNYVEVFRKGVAALPSAREVRMSDMWPNAFALFYSFRFVTGSGQCESPTRLPSGSQQ